MIEHPKAVALTRFFQRLAEVKDLPEDQLREPMWDAASELFDAGHDSAREFPGLRAVPDRP
ncbi:hypothetical protein [Conexibacter sp. W3-3-2]|uniref:hypothetical protein n=1 Tax=Conexibacter sp. W3-3-2 TaxID=2675227 RepID=UPI0018AA3087|nr:hypothetical protein [Conexibacter sp. W3-3-2]